MTNTQFSRLFVFILLTFAVLFGSCGDRFSTNDQAWQICKGVEVSTEIIQLCNDMIYAVEIHNSERVQRNEHLKQMSWNTLQRHAQLIVDTDSIEAYNSILYMDIGYRETP